MLAEACSWRLVGVEVVPHQALAYRLVENETTAPPSFLTRAANDPWSEVAAGVPRELLAAYAGSIPPRWAT